MTRGQRVLLWIAGIAGILFGIYLVGEAPGRLRGDLEGDVVFLSIVAFIASAFALYKAMSRGAGQ